jgi:DNA-binding LacI/PurR family transcriptional regulator
MVEHLRGLGHSHVLVLTPGVHSLPASESVTVIETGFSALDATTTAIAALSATPHPTAVFALSDAIACGVYAACRELGLRVPEDVSVAGFDDHPLSGLLHPPLTTVGWDTPRAAVTAAQILKRAFDGGQPASVEFPPALVLRDSTGPA